MKHKFQTQKASKSFKEQHEILGGEGVVYRTTQNGNYWQCPSSYKLEQHLI